MLCSESWGSGGVFQDSIGKSFALEKYGDLVFAIQSSPAFLGGLSQLEHHREAGFAGAVAFGAVIILFDPSPYNNLKEGTNGSSN